MTTRTLEPELLHKMDAYWRAANYLSVGQIYRPGGIAHTQGLGTGG